jgi:hypothetical protein
LKPQWIIKKDKPKIKHPEISENIGKHKIFAIPCCVWREQFVQFIFFLSVAAASVPSESGSARCSREKYRQRKREKETEREREREREREWARNRSEQLDISSYCRAAEEGRAGK